MKNILAYLTAVIMLVIISLPSGAQADGLHYDISPMISANQPLDYDDLWPVQGELPPPRQHAVTVPARLVNDLQLEGMNMTFEVAISQDERVVALDWLMLTKLTFSIYQRDVNGLNPVVNDEGRPLVDIPIENFGGPGGFIPSVRMTQWSPDEPVTVTGNEPTIGTMVPGVTSILIENHSLPWNFVSDFRRPQVGESYEVVWDIRIIPVIDGTQCPEVQIGKTPQAKNMEFSYGVVDFPMPRNTSFWRSTEGVDVLRFNGPHIENFVLQRSPNGRDWTDVHPEDPNVVHTYVGGNEREWRVGNEKSSRHFYRLNWRPETQIWFSSGSRSVYRDKFIEVIPTYNVVSVDVDGNSIVDQLLFDYSFQVSAIGDEKVYIPRNLGEAFGPVEIRSYISTKPPSTQFAYATHSTADSEGDNWVIRAGESEEVQITIAVESSGDFSASFLTAIVNFWYRTEPGTPLIKIVDRTGTFEWLLE